MPATARSRLPSRSPRCSLRPTCSTRAARRDAARYLRETADCLERTDRALDLCHRHRAMRSGTGSKGYYVRIAPPDLADAASPKDGFVPIKNRPPGETDQPAQAIVSPDALALVRFGLRAADDPRIVDTVKVIDAAAALRPAAGPGLVSLQRRRLWRARRRRALRRHRPGQALAAAGRRTRPLRAGRGTHRQGREPADDARRHRPASAACCPSRSGTAPTCRERELRRGGPTGSAMPLVWAHSEHIKLLRSLRDGAVFDMPPQGVERYIEGKTGSPIRSWRFNNKIRSMPSGKTLRVELLAAAVVHWSSDAGATFNDSQDQSKCVRHSRRRFAGRRYPAGWNHCLHFLLAGRRPLGRRDVLRRRRRSTYWLDRAAIGYAFRGHFEKPKTLQTSICQRRFDHDRGAIRRAGALRGNRRPRAQEDISGALCDGRARRADRAGHRRRARRLGRRAAAGARPRRHRQGARQHRRSRSSPSSPACCAMSAATTATSRPSTS